MISSFIISVFRYMIPSHGKWLARIMISTELSNFFMVLVPFHTLYNNNKKTSSYSEIIWIVDKTTVSFERRKYRVYIKNIWWEYRLAAEIIQKIHIFTLITSFYGLIYCNESLITMFWACWWCFGVTELPKNLKIMNFSQSESHLVGFKSTFHVVILAPRTSPPQESGISTTNRFECLETYRIM